MPFVLERGLVVNVGKFIVPGMESNKSARIRPKGWYVWQRLTYVRQDMSRSPRSRGCLRSGTARGSMEVTAAAAIVVEQAC